MKIADQIALDNFFWKSNKDDVALSILSGERNLAACGQFSFSFVQPRLFCLVRDVLGINKLFYVLDRETQKLSFSNNLHSLALNAGNLSRVYSVPAGHALKVENETGERKLISYCDLRKKVNSPDNSFELSKFQSGVAAGLDAFFVNLKDKIADSRVFVCLSGGLDSSVVAYFAKKHLPRVSAVTFSYEGDLSEDFHAAKAIAESLELPFFPVFGQHEMSHSRLDEILIWGQDWRDFNVHCAWVNYQLADQVRAQFPREKLIFLTGDLMNEYVADYAPVNYSGTIYYPSPRVDKARLRSFYLYGLDSGDREIGVFSRFGITGIQPYSAVLDEYLTVPADLLDRPDCKEILNLPLIENPAVRRLVGRAKVRAQVGGKSGGTLALFHDSGISQDLLKARWKALFSSIADGFDPGLLIQAGRYRHEL